MTGKSGSFCYNITQPRNFIEVWHEWRTLVSCSKTDIVHGSFEFMYTRRINVYEVTQIGEKAQTFRGKFVEKER